MIRWGRYLILVGFDLASRCSVSSEYELKTQKRTDPEQMLEVPIPRIQDFSETSPSTKDIADDRASSYIVWSVVDEVAQDSARNQVLPKRFACVDSYL